MMTASLVRTTTALPLLAALSFMAPGVRPLAPRLDAQSQPRIETVVPFDSTRRIMVVTPTLVTRLGLAAPSWPVAGAFREAKLYRIDDGEHVLVVQQIDGAVARFALDNAAVAALQSAINTALIARGRSGDRLLGAGTATGLGDGASMTTGVATGVASGLSTGSGVVVSQPAGNTFVRNQTFLGLVAYGPATAAILSEGSGAAAAGGYFLAAGTSFFVAANTVKGRVVTRAQAARAAHGGTRGALTGLGIALIAHADGGPGYGGPILAGAIGGSIAGFQQARGLSDGEAASAGFFADLGALTVLGAGGSAGAFKGRTTRRLYDPNNPQYGVYSTTDNSLRGHGKATVAAAIGANIIGYAIGPRYARRAAYNVTAGDVNVAFAGALLGGVTASSFVSDGGEDTPKYGLAAAGVLAGAFLADRGLVRRADRTSADGTLVQLGALAGALMGGGVAALFETETQGALAFAGAGGVLGLLAADGIIKSAPDAGPLRGIMQSSSLGGDGRVFVTLGPVSRVRVTF